MNIFFTTKDPLDSIIQNTLKNQTILKTKHILTGWTNIVIEVTTNQNTYFFRFPRNPFWSKTIEKDAAVCNFIEGKTSFYTPQMQLFYDLYHRPFSVHKKITGYTLNDRIYHLSHSTLTSIAYDIVKFIKELSSIRLDNAPNKIKVSLSSFLKELDDKHYAKHLSVDHDFIKRTEKNTLVHGDLNLGNILLNHHDKVIGFIDFGFAGTGNPNMDISRILSRPVPDIFATTILNNFTHPKNHQKLSEINRMKLIWQHIDAGYADHIRSHFPEITLPNL